MPNLHASPFCERSCPKQVCGWYPQGSQNESLFDKAVSFIAWEQMRQHYYMVFSIIKSFFHWGITLTIYRKWKIFCHLDNWHFLQYGWDCVLITIQISSISFEGHTPILSNLLHKKHASPQQTLSKLTCCHFLLQRALNFPYLARSTSKSSLWSGFPVLVLTVGHHAWWQMTPWSFLHSSWFASPRPCCKVPLFFSFRPSADDLSWGERIWSLPHHLPFSSGFADLFITIFFL